MITSSHSQPKFSQDLIRYLQEKLGVSDRALTLGLRQAEIEQAPLPIVMWSFGLLSLSQYEQVLDWEANQE